jgi:hypothetical protein
VETPKGEVEKSRPKASWFKDYFSTGKTKVSVFRHSL